MCKERGILSILLAGVCLTVMLAVPAAAEAFGYNREWERSVKAEVWEHVRQREGVCEEPEANEMLNRITSRLIPAVQAREELPMEYSFFVNNKEVPNAFASPGANVTVNHGLFTMLNYNEDELAFIVGHEMGHVQGNHLVKTMNARMKVGLVAGLVMKNQSDWGGRVLTSVAYRHVLQKGYGKPHEWEADARGFTYSTAAGYNPAAGAAAFQRMTEKIGDHQYNALQELLAPEDHPSNAARIKKIMEFTKEHSGGRVYSDGKAVQINGKDVFTPAAGENISAAERSYLITGNLARAIHQLQGPQRVAVADGALYMGDYPIMTLLYGDEDGEALAQKINVALGV